MSSAGIFFSHALLFDDLQEDVVCTVTEIVNYARRHNDIWEMWADDMCVFGLDPVFSLAQKHPQYTYLLGVFIIPYWDDEHADYAMNYLRYSYIRQGFDIHVMKTYCYYDNDTGRLYLSNTDTDNNDTEKSIDLVTYFRDNREQYALFKNMLRERFSKQEFIQYGEQYNTDNPLKKFSEQLEHHLIALLWKIYSLKIPLTMKHTNYKKR